MTHGDMTIYNQPGHTGFIGEFATHGAHSPIPRPDIVWSPRVGMHKRILNYTFGSALRFGGATGPRAYGEYF